MRPAPGWCVVREIETAEQFAGSPIVLPVQSRDRLTRNQVEVQQVGPASHCEMEDCWCDGVHEAPPALQDGAWAVIRPQAKHPVPGETKVFLVPTSEIVAVIF